MFKRRWQREAENQLRTLEVESQVSAVMHQAISDIHAEALELATAGLGEVLSGGDPEIAANKTQQAQNLLDQVRPFIGENEE